MRGVLPLFQSVSSEQTGATRSDVGSPQINTRSLGIRAPPLERARLGYFMQTSIYLRVYITSDTTVFIGHRYLCFLVHFSTVYSQSFGRNRTGIHLDFFGQVPREEARDLPGFEPRS